MKSDTFVRSTIASNMADMEGDVEPNTESAPDPEQAPTAENGTRPRDPQSHGGEADTGDVFKKPALFAPPPRTNKRSSVATASRPEPAVEPPGAPEPPPSRGAEPEPAPVEAAGPEDTTAGAEDEAATEEKKDSSAPGPGPKGRGEQQQVSASRSKSKPQPQPQPKPRVLPPAGKFPPLPYTEPPWGGEPPEQPYALEILKNGTIVDTVPLTARSFFLVGRLPVCDVSLEHPSISRYHAVIQYRGKGAEGGSVGEEAGFYVHDLGSTHGTVVNKNKVPPKTFIRLRVGHVIKFGGSTRLFILQGPEFDEEEESELTVTELRQRAQKQKAELERRMMGGGSDEDDEDNDDGEDKDGDEGQEGEGSGGKSKASSEDSGCSWGMAEEAAPEEDDNEENPFSTEFHEDQEAAYLKDPKKALQGFYDREGEELEFEYEDKSHGTWLCRIKLPVDDAVGRQLVAEATHAGKKKEAAVQCCLEACRMLEARGLLRQEAVSRKRKKKNWEDEDFYDSDDDTFLDRTGTVEKKRQERMKKAGKIEERPETYDSLVAKLSAVEKELAETQRKLSADRGDASGLSSEDPLDAFMTAVRSEAAMDGVQRRKLHVHVANLRKDAQRLRKLVELTRPAQMPSLLPSGSSEPEKPKKTLPLFGAMKGGSKFRLKTGTIGKLPPKRPNLPAELFNTKGPSASVEEEEEEEDEEDSEEKGNKKEDEEGAANTQMDVDSEESSTSSGQQPAPSPEPKDGGLGRSRGGEQPGEAEPQQQEAPRRSRARSKAEPPPQAEAEAEGGPAPAAEPGPKKNVRKKVMGPSRPPAQQPGQYPEDDPDYCVWMPPAGQIGDGRTALNDKYGY